MNQRNNTSKKSTFKSCIAIAALVCTVFAGTLTAEVVRSEQTQRGLDPMVLAIVDGFESGKLITAKEYTTPRILKPRAKDRKEQVTITDRSRLMVKFADELKVRVATNGQLVSRTHKPLETVIDTILSLGVTISPAADVEEAKVNDLIARAEARSGRQMPDIGGIFWIDGPLTAVKAAADVFYIMPEVEWLNAPMIHPSDSPYRGKKLAKKTGRVFNHPNREISLNQLPKMFGACMFRTGMCQESVSPKTCEDFGGTFLGLGSVCKSNQNEGANRGAGTACCTLSGCTDTNFAGCMAINGIWYGADGDTCVELADSCPPDFTTFDQCGAFGDLDTYFTGSCYIDQTLQFVSVNRPMNAAGCLDVTIGGEPNPQEAFIDEDQNCCADISALVPSCGIDSWDAVCASYANSGQYQCLRDNGCQTPFGPRRPIRESPGNPQPKMNFANDCPLNPFDANCWPFDPAVPFFTPQATTPDLFKMGLQTWATDEPLSYNDWGLSSANALPQLLPWPMGGGVIGDVSYLMNDWPPALPNLLSPSTGLPTGVGVEGEIATTMWGGEGLDLYPINPDADPGGMNSDELYSGLYGLGQFHEDMNEGPNGTYGAGVTVVVLDYAADIQSYAVTHEGSTTIYGSVHEELGNVDIEGPETGHDEVLMYFDPTAPFAYSRHHGSAVLGILAGDWDPDNPDSNVGIRGLVPEADFAFYPLIGAVIGEDGEIHGEGRSATAWIHGMITLEPGDVIAATYNPQDQQGGGFNNLDYNPFSHDQITVATALGISVIIGAGMNGEDLGGAVTPSGTDSGAIVAGAVSPGLPHKRYANGQGSSNFVVGDGGTYGETNFSKVTASAFATGVTTCGFGPNMDNWLGYQTVSYSNECNYNIVASRSYTNNFSGTSAAAAIVAGCVIAMQGYARQVFDTPLSPLFTRLYIGGGSYAGMTPSDPNDPAQGGDPILNYPQSTGLSSENNMNGGGNTWDFIDVPAGTGNLVGNIVNPWRSCQDALADPIFDTPGINDILIISGEHHLGNSGSIAAKDSMYFSLIPVQRDVGDFYELPDDYTGPGDHVTYLSTATVSDIYLSGLLRGGLSPGNIMNWNVVMLDSTYTSTILLLYMWDFSRRDWVQAASSELLSAGDVNDEGKIEVNFLVQRASRMLDRTGLYHARFVTVTQPDGDNQLYPYYYDQIRVQSASFPGPVTVP